MKRRGTEVHSHPNTQLKRKKKRKKEEEKKKERVRQPAGVFRTAKLGQPEIPNSAILPRLKFENLDGCR